jgi:MoaA/NifB/PqqE/SkfB family radical SAM enzyme
MEIVDPCLLKSPREGYRVTMPIGIDCPLKCKHCFQGGVAKHSVDTDTNLVSLSKMGDSGVSKLYFDGAEPTTNKDIPIYLKHIENMRDGPDAQKYLFETVSLATNGYYITETSAKILKDYGLKNMMVSLDGGTREAHDSFRSKGSYDIALNAIKILVDQSFDVRIGTTIWRGSVRGLDMIAQIGRDLGVKEVSYNWLQPFGEALKHPGIRIKDAHFQDVAYKIAKIGSENPDIGVNFHRGGVLDPNKKCKGGESIAYVSGEWVWPCSWISMVAPEFKSEMSLRDATLTDILNEDRVIQTFRKRFSSSGYQGCPAASKMHTGTFDGNDPISEGGIHILNQEELK